MSEVGGWAADARCPGWLCSAWSAGWGTLCCAALRCAMLGWGLRCAAHRTGARGWGCWVGWSMQSHPGWKGVQPSFVLAPASAGQMCAPGSGAVGQRAYVGSVVWAVSPQAGQRAAPGGAGGPPQAPSALALAAPMPDSSQHTGQSLLQLGKEIWEKQRTRERGGRATVERPGRAERCRCWGSGGCSLAPG